MGFSKKASKGSSSNVSNVDWDAFNEHLLEQIGEEVESRVGIISGIIDLGVQPRPDYVEEYTGTKKQDAQLKSGRSYLDADEENIITELKPVDQVAIFVDFPEIMINYGEFFNDGEDDWKPYRHLITGENWDKQENKMFAKGVSLSCKPDDKAPSGWGYDRKSTISKLAIGSGVIKRAPVDQNFDIADLMNGVITMDLVAEESGKYVNIKATNISSKHPAIPVPEHDIECFGIGLDGDNDADTLKFIRASIRNTLERAQGWETSGLKAELDAQEKAATKASEDSTEDDEEEDDTPKKRTPRKAPAKKTTKRVAEEEEDEDDEEEETPPPKKRTARKPVKRTTKKKEPEPEEEDEDDYDEEIPW